MPGILIDVMRLVLRRSIGLKPAGIDRVGIEYVRQYADRARAVLSLGPLAGALSRSESRRLFDSLLDGDAGILPLAIEMAVRSLAWSWILPGTGNSVLLNTSELWLNSRHYAAQLRWIGARPVFFVHDLIPISHPEYFRAGERREFVAYIHNILGLSRGIVVNSRATEASLLAHAKDVGVVCPPIAVAPLGPGVVPPSEPGPRPIPDPYFVVLGTIEPRKNILLLLHVWREMAVARTGIVPRLCVVGRRGWECENVVDMLERCEPLKGVVVERNDCGDAELARLLHHAQALLMPSFAEGYGLPVAEALAAGVPVIASDLPVFREMAGEIPEYADPTDGRRWKELILDYAQPGSVRRAAQLERLKGHRPMTWARHFEIVDRFLERLSDKPNV